MLPIAFLFNPHCLVNAHAFQTPCLQFVAQAANPDDILGVISSDVQKLIQSPRRHAFTGSVVCKKSFVCPFNPRVSCSQIIMMGTPILREENALRSSNVAMFQDHPCSQEPCHNGGRCNPQLDTYECVCLSGFSGGHCQNSEYLRPSSSPVLTAMMYISLDPTCWRLNTSLHSIYFVSVWLAYM